LAFGNGADVVGPLGVLFLLVLGAVALVNGITRQAMLPAAPERKCANCGKPAQADWTTCPYCGKSLA
jgi:hypothetical protein